MKPGIMAIVEKMGPPKKGAPSDDEAAEGESDYSAAEDSMAAFIAAVKSGDAKAALDAYADVKANC